MEPALRDVVANGLRHRVLEWDGGGRDTVLCLHGFLDSGWAWFEVGPALARAGFHVVAPDLRGHGDTEWIGPGGYYHFADYLLDVADLAEALARDRLLLAGHSMGGSVAFQFAGALPGRVARLAALESHLFVEREEAHPARAARWIASVRAARSRALRPLPSVEAAAERIRRHDPRCPEATARFLAERATRPAAGGLAFKHDPLHLTPGPHPFSAERVKAFWRAVGCPVLLVEGAETDRPRPPDLEDRIACFADARRVVVEGAAHMLLRHRPQEVARLLVEFLAG
ncbi:MAG TPA: alpha/beta hydrolase [Anaeromyxobacteraceae bacterium]